MSYIAENMKVVDDRVVFEINVETQAAGAAQAAAQRAQSAASEADSLRSEVSADKLAVASDREAVELARADVEEKAGIAEQAAQEAANSAAKLVFETGSGKNLFDPSRLIDGKNIHPTTGNLFDEENTRISELISVEEGSNYSITGLPIGSKRYRFLSNTMSVVAAGPVTPNPIVLLVPPNARFLQFTAAYSTEPLAPYIMVAKSDTVNIPYEPYEGGITQIGNEKIRNASLNLYSKEDIDERLLDLNIISSLTRKPLINFINSYLITGKINDLRIYKRYEDAPDYSGLFILDKLQNTEGSNGVLMQIRDEDNVLRFSLSASEKKSGIEKRMLFGLSGFPYVIVVEVDWDQIDSNLPGRVFFRSSSFNDEGIISKFTDVEKQIYPPTPFGGNQYLVDCGFVRDAYKDGRLSNFSKINLTYVRNEENRVTLQFSDESGLVGQFHSTSIPLQTDINTYLISSLSNSGVVFYFQVDWSKYLYHLAFSQSYPLTIDLAQLRHGPKNTVDERVRILETKARDHRINPLVLSTFNDPLPHNFMLKFFALEKDLEILLVGDSLTGLINSSSSLPSYKIVNLPPGMTSKHWSYLLWQRIVKNKPKSYRQDSGYFSLTGTWTKINSGKIDTTPSSNHGEWSVSAETFMSNTEGAKLSFIFDTDEFEKCGIVFSKYPDGGDSIIKVAEGDGKVLISTDKVNFVEANNFTFSTNGNPNGLSSSQLLNEGIASNQRHRRLWVKRSSPTGDVTINVERVSGFLYLWGVEFWNGNTVFVTNLGRGGRSTNLLRQNISDVFDRHPDLVLFEFPLANEESRPLNDLLNDYDTYINRFEELSNDYEDTDLITMLPSGRSRYWIGDNVAQSTSDGSFPILKGSRVYSSLMAKRNAHLKVINLQERLINEAKFAGMTIEESLTGSEAYGDTFTSDGVHINDLGSALWAKYLCSIFT